MLFRKIQSVIEEKLQSDSKKILLVDGARQVGKTYIIRYVWKKLFSNFIEINMIEDFKGDKLFSSVNTVEDFYLQVSMIAGDKMGDKSDTLIFLDEIQQYPELLTLLKFLQQDGKFTYIASGSFFAHSFGKYIVLGGEKICIINFVKLFLQYVVFCFVAGCLWESVPAK